MEKSVIDWLEAASLKWKDKIAYEDAKAAVTFGACISMARGIGGKIRKILSGKAPVAVVMERKWETISVFFGVIYSGHPYAPIDGTLPIPRLKKMMDTLQPALVIADPVFLEKLTSACAAEIRSTEELLSDSQDSDPSALSELPEISLTDPLYIIFTSGSSGNPKGVLTSHLSLMNYIHSYAKVMQIDASDRLGCQSPLDYIAAIRDIYVPILTGAYSYLLPKQLFMTPDALALVLREKKLTALGWSTSALVVLTKLGLFRGMEGQELSCVKKICFSGSIMPPDVLGLWLKALPAARFVNQYGPTETTASCTYYEIDRSLRLPLTQALPIGTPYDNYRIFLLTEELTEVPKGEIGEICVSGIGLAYGYYNDPERTQKAFIQNPLEKAYPERIYRTGDLGRFREDGLLEYHGRRDRQIKHMGHRVELDEVEAAALESGLADECACVYDAENEVLWLFFTGKEDAQPKNLVLKLRESLPGFMIPRKIRKLDAIPKLPNGKIDFQALKPGRDAH